MAVTIEQEPYEHLNLSGNPIVWTFSSDETGQQNFTYYIELYINGDLDSTHEVVLESGIYSKFDASTYAENNTNVQTLPTDITGTDPLNSCTIYIKVYDRYGDPAEVQALSVATSTEVMTIKAKKEIDDWIEFLDVDDDYTRTTSIPYIGLLLTEDPDIRIRESETLYFTTVFRATGVTYNFVVAYYDTDGTLLDTWTNANTASGLVDTVALVYADVESAYGGAGTFADVSYLHVYSGKAQTDYSVVTIDRSCALESYQVHFLSQIGAIDSFTFNRLGRKTMKTTAKKFQTNVGGFDGSSFVYTSGNLSAANFQMTSEKKMTLSSEWVTETKKDFLLDNLFQSPYVILETATGQRRIANIGKSAKFNKQYFDGLFNIEIEIDLGIHTSMTV